jgi:hypothetical protein
MSGEKKMQSPLKFDSDLRRKLSPDLAEVLHMLQALENRLSPDMPRQETSVPVR